VQVWRSDAPMRSRLAERGGAGDGGAFSLVRPDSPSYDPSTLRSVAVPLLQSDRLLPRAAWDRRAPPV
jgi:hypothetical protein